MGRITASDYAFYRAARGRAGTYKEVCEFIAAQDAMVAEHEAATEAERQARVGKVRQHIAANWVRFDFRENYKP